ncbi:ABC transporter ATP-binding protein [Polaribacter porphyrae]|uniref:Multidrug ABC transporter ATP-binding protein n=1 Tax=Polaribacter porphyrae TaxID=1137780 RepID=A0A2S7WQF3_9FLAO|nr:ABC transporter ATP-binding protein [Polaribacter porphyrae]PQJ79829.1 multidrug ABC transporter ATP-binding protein [Polaribacter porphyrae]
MNTLEINNVSKIYANGTKALNGVSLKISNGMYGLLGPNGAGKSSLMRTIAGLQTTSSGNVIFNGNDISKEPSKIRQYLGYLPQEFGVYPRMSALDLLNHIAVLKGVLNKKARQAQIEALLIKTNLFEHRKKAVSNFSGGMRRRFGIAQALLGNPKIIMVDEPTAGLDPEERNRFLDVLSEVSSSVIVLLSTHIVEDIRVLCSNMAILYNGQIVKQGSPENLIQDLQGKIWKKPVPKSDLAVLKNKHNVISTRLLGGKTSAYVFSEQQLTTDFEAVPTDLEHVYFHILKTSKTNNYAA